MKYLTLVDGNFSPFLLFRKKPPLLHQVRDFRHNVLVLLLLTIVALGFFPSHLLAQPADGQVKNPFANDPKAIARGRAVFKGICSGYCHGTGKATRCPNLFDCEWEHGGTDANIFRTVTEGVKRTEMIGFKGKLPDEMIWKILAYIRSASKCKENLATSAH